MKTSIIKTRGPADISTLALPSRSEHCFTVSGRDHATMHRLLRGAAGERQAIILSRFEIIKSALEEQGFCFADTLRT